MPKDIFRYPIDIDNEEHVNSMLIFINDSQGESDDESVDVQGAENTISLSDLGNVDAGDLFDAAASSIEGSVRNQFVNDLTIQRKVIQLYMPDNVGYSTNLDWQNEDLGNLVSIAQLGGSIRGAAGGGDLESVLEGMQGMAGRVEREAINSLIEAAGSIGSAFGVNAQDAAEKLSRQTLNDHVEVLFKNVGHREFTFNFHFVPRNKAEAQEVGNIIKILRYYSHPFLSGDHQDRLELDEDRNVVPGAEENGESDYYGRYLQYPAQFQPVFMYKTKNGRLVRNPTLPRIGSCAVTNIDHTYGPNEYSVFDDDDYPLPTEITLSITFQELHTLNRRRIAQGGY